MEYLHIVGSVASVLGAVAAVLAWLSARSARQAAEAARRAVLAITVADELKRMCSEAQGLVVALSAREAEQANRLAGELRAEIGRLTARRGNVLGPTNCAELVRARAALRAIGAADDGPDMEAALGRALAGANRAAEQLAGVLGHVQRTADEGQAEEQVR